MVERPGDRDPACQLPLRCAAASEPTRIAQAGWWGTSPLGHRYQITYESNDYIFGQPMSAANGLRQCEGKCAALGGTPACLASQEESDWVMEQIRLNYTSTLNFVPFGGKGYTYWGTLHTNVSLRERTEELNDVTNCDDCIRDPEHEREDVHNTSHDTIQERGSNQIDARNEAIPKRL